MLTTYSKKTDRCSDIDVRESLADSTPSVRYLVDSRGATGKRVMGRSKGAPRRTSCHQDMCKRELGKDSRVREGNCRLMEP